MPQQRQQFGAYSQFLRRRKRPSCIELRIFSNFHIVNPNREWEQLQAHISQLHLPVKFLLEFSLDFVVILIHIDQGRKCNHRDNNDQYNGN